MALPPCASSPVGSATCPSPGRGDPQACLGPISVDEVLRKVGLGCMVWGGAGGLSSPGRVGYSSAFKNKEGHLLCFTELQDV